MLIVDMIKQVAEKLDNERVSIQENSGWVVQYLSCGHAVEITHNNPLVKACKENTHVDALIRPQEECPICNNEWDSNLYARIIFIS